MFSMRWRLIVMQCGANLPPAPAFRYSMIGIFFNQTLPSTVGGDAARIWLLARDGAGWKAATYSVLVDRAIGLLSLVLLVIVCLPWTLTLIQHPTGRLALTVIALGCLGATAAFVALGAIKWAWLDRFWATRHVSATARTGMQHINFTNPFQEAELRNEDRKTSNHSQDDNRPDDRHAAESEQRMIDDQRDETEERK